MAAGPKKQQQELIFCRCLRAALLKITSHFALIKKTKTLLSSAAFSSALIKAHHQSCRDQKHRAKFA